MAKFMVVFILLVFCVWLEPRPWFQFVPASSVAIIEVQNLWRERMDDLFARRPALTPSPAPRLVSDVTKNDHSDKLGAQS